MSTIGHAVRASLPSKERKYQLEVDGLTWVEDGGSGGIRYANVKSLQLLRSPKFADDIRQCRVLASDGTKVTINALHYVGLAQFEDRTGTYIPFVRELIRRVAVARPDAMFFRGSSLMWYVWLVLLIACVLIGAGLLILMLAKRQFEWNAAWPLLLVMGIVPSVWRFLKNGRAKSFDPNAPPMELLGAEAVK